MKRPKVNKGLYVSLSILAPHKGKKLSGLKLANLGIPYERRKVLVEHGILTPDVDTNGFEVFKVVDDE